MLNWLEVMERKDPYDERKSKCDKRKKRNVYKSRRGYEINGKTKTNKSKRFS